MFIYPSKPIVSTFNASSISWVNSGFATIVITLVATTLVSASEVAVTSITLSPLTLLAVSLPSESIVANSEPLFTSHKTVWLSLPVTTASRLIVFPLFTSELPLIPTDILSLTGGFIGVTFRVMLIVALFVLSALATAFISTVLFVE